VKTTSAREVSLSRSLKAALLGISVLSGLVLVSSEAPGQTVPAGTNLYTQPATPSTIWNLEGGAYLSDGTSASILKPIPSGLTINGVDGGSTITMNDGLGHSASIDLSGGGTLNLSNVTFTGGAAGTSTVKNGGVIYSSGAVVLNGSGTLAFTNNATNWAQGYGGAIYASGVSINNAGGTIILTGNRANGLNSSGGAIYSIGTVTIDSSEITITDNHATAGGGAIYANTGNVLIGNNASVVTLTDNTGSSAGAIYGAGTVTIHGREITVTGNQANSSAGGAISGGQDVLIGNDDSIVMFSGNRATGTTTGILTHGGAVYSYRGAVTINGGEIELVDNSSTQIGGAIYGYTGVSIGATGGTVTLDHNSAGTFGGTIYNQTGTVTIAGTEVTVTNNSAGSYGGAIYNNSGIVTISGNVIKVAGNHADNLVGAIYATGDILIGGAGSKIILSNNSTGTSIGAIYSAAGSIMINGSEVTVADNTAAANYGAIYATGNVSIGDAGGTVSVTSNKALGGAAGAIRSGGAVTINGSMITLSENLAGSGRGGAIYSAGDVSIGNADSALTLTGNSASTDGGAVFASSSITLTAGVVSSISNNAATNGNGGALWSGGTITTNASGGDIFFSGNTAGLRGGAIWAGGNVVLNATGGDIAFSGNNANGQANAIWFENGVFASTIGGTMARDFAHPDGDTTTFLEPIANENAMLLAGAAGGATASFNAAVGRTITFLDPIANNAANGLLNVVKTGPGAVVFDGSQYADAADRWSQVYGNTEVQTGTFEVRNNAVYGALASDVGGTAGPSSLTVNSGATLAVVGAGSEVRADDIAISGILTGSGIVTGSTVQIATGGTLAPGNGTPGSSMTVNGNLVFQSGAYYDVEVNPATASFTTVNGTAALAGTVNATYAVGKYTSKQYTILTATGGVNGSFSSLTNTNLPANFTDSLSYDVNNAYLNLTLDYTPDFGGGLNRNQQNVANTLVNYFNTTGGIPTAFGTLSPSGLTQVSGELATASQQTTFDAMTQFMGVMSDPANAGRGEDTCNQPSALYRKAPVKADCFASRWNVWAAGYGGSRNTDGNAIVGSNNATSRVYGVAAGADYRISPDTLIGFALGGGGTNFGLANGLGSGRSDLFQAGVYARHDIGAAYLSGALAYGWQDITTDRTVTVAGIDRLRANFNANAYSGRIESGWRFATAWGGLTPYAAGQFTTFDLPDYAEQAIVGSNIFALNYAGKSVTASRSELGLRTDTSFALADGILTLRSRFAWGHNFDDERSITATFQSLPGASFVVKGASIGQNAALVSASAETTWRNGWSAGLTFDGDFSDTSSNYTGKGVIRYRW